MRVVGLEIVEPKKADKVVKEEKVVKPEKEEVATPKEEVILPKKA